MEIDYTAQTEAHRQFMAEGMRRQVTAVERTAVATEQSAKAVATIRTILVVWAILTVLGVAFLIAAATSR